MNIKKMANYNFFENASQIGFVIESATFPSAHFTSISVARKRRNNIVALTEGLREGLIKRTARFKSSSS